MARVALTRGSAAAITMTDLAVADDTVVIGNKTYTFKAAPSAAYEVVQASAADGVITLQARVAGYHINGLYLAETLTNGTITGGGNTFAAVTSATLGVGELQDWLRGLLDTGQVNADIIREIDEAII
jgi:hypothetical protein